MTRTTQYESIMVALTAISEELTAQRAILTQHEKALKSLSSSSKQSASAKTTAKKSASTSTRTKTAKKSSPVSEPVSKKIDKLTLSEFEPNKNKDGFYIWDYPKRNGKSHGKSYKRCRTAYCYAMCGVRVNLTTMDHDYPGKGWFKAHEGEYQKHKKAFEKKYHYIKTADR